MKKIGIYFSLNGLYDYPFNFTRYIEAYQDIVTKIEKEGIEVYIVRGKSYLGKGEFSNSSRFDKNNRLYDTGNVKVDLIFNRDSEDTIPFITDCNILNNPEFDNFCRDKLLTFKEFEDISPKTALINSFDDFQKLIIKYNLKSSTKVAIKDQFGEGGKDSFIGKISEINEKTLNSWNNILFQEFIDSSIGIPGICEGLHDIRVTIIDGKIVSSNIRQPKKGSYFANFSQGGTGFTIDTKEIPKDLVEIVEGIIPKFEKYNDLFFSIDFMNSINGFKLVEFNSRPGVQHISIVKKPNILNHAIANLLIKIVKK